VPVAALLALVLAALYFAPALLERAAIGWIERSYRVRASVGELRASLTGEVAVTDLRVDTLDGRRLAGARSLVARVEPWPLLLGRARGRVELDGWALDARRRDDGAWSFEGLEREDQDGDADAPRGSDGDELPDVELELVARDGAVRLFDPASGADEPAHELVAIELAVALEGLERPADVRLRAELVQPGASGGPGTVEGTGTVVADPLEARLDVRLDGFELARLAAIAVLVDPAFEPPVALAGALAGDARVALDADGWSATLAAEAGGFALAPAAADARSAGAASLTGALGTRVTLASAGDATRIDARVDLTATDLPSELDRLALDVLGLGDGPLDLPLVLAARAELRPDASAAVEALELETPWLTGALTGALDWSGEAVRVDGLDARFTVDRDVVVRALGNWLPGEPADPDDPADERDPTVALALGGSVTAATPAALARGLTGTCEVALGDWRVGGLAASGTLALALEEGVACEGRLALGGGELALRARAPLAERPDDAGAVALGAPLVLGGNFTAVGVSAELRRLLARVHPALGELTLLDPAAVSGAVSGSLELELPDLGTLADDGWRGLPWTAATGRGTLGVDGARLDQNAFLGWLFAELGVELDDDVRLQPLRFALEEGRVTYLSPWTWTVADAATTFTGSLGLDRSLDLVWNVPVTERLVERHRVLRAVEGQSLAIPLRGSIDRPRLEWRPILDELARGALQQSAAQELGLGELFGTGDPAELLRRADELWGRGERAAAVELYERIREEFALSLVYLLNKGRIKDRIREARR